MSRRAIVILGASGSVGQAVVEAALQTPALQPVVTLVRRPQPSQREALREVVVPEMTPAALERATTEVVRGLGGDVVGLSVLGVGAGTGKLTIDEHRAIDVELNAAFARGLKAGGVRHLALMSAVGANPAAKATGSGAAGMARYARVKGESEEAVKAQGPAVVSVFRPAMIIGSQHTPWLLEKLLPVFGFVTPGRFKSITVQQIAAAMISTSVEPPAESGVYHYPEMIELGQRSARRNSATTAR